MAGVHPVFEAAVKQTLAQPSPRRHYHRLLQDCRQRHFKGVATQAISTLPPQALQGLPPEFAPLLSPGAIAALPPEQLQQIEPLVLQALPPEVVQGLQHPLQHHQKKKSLPGLLTSSLSR